MDAVCTKTFELTPSMPAETSTKVHESIALEGALSSDEFAQGIVATLTTSSAVQTPVVVVESFSTVASSSMSLPGTASEFTTGSSKHSALAYGLQKAACGEESVAICSATIVGISRRRMQEIRRRLQGSATVTVDFSVTSADDAVLDALQPTTFAGAFATAVNEQAGGALAGVAASDLSVQEPDIATTFEYTVLLNDVGDVESARTTLADDSAVVTGVSSVVPGSTITASATQPAPPPPPPSPPPPPPTPPSPAPADADEDGSSWVWVLVVLVLVAGIGGGVAFFVITKQKAKTKSPDSDDGQMFENPMMEENGAGE